MRTLCLLIATLLLLAACASDPSVRAGGAGDGRYNRGTAGVGWKF